MVTQAGSSQLGDKVVDRMGNIAKEKNLENCETGALVAQKALREIRQELMDVNKDSNFSYSDRKQMLLDNSLDLIVACYFNREPYMFTLDIDRAIWFQVKTPFAAIGIGGYLGEFLLREYAQADPKFQFAWPMSIAVVEKVIDNVNGCGQPIRAGIAYPMPSHIADADESDKEPYPQSLVIAPVSQREIE